MYLGLWLNSHLSTCDDDSRTVGRTFQEDGAKSIWQVENGSLNWGWRLLKMAFTVFQEIHSASSAWKTQQSWFIPSNPPISSSCLRRTSDDPWTGYWTYGRIYLSYICDTTIHIYTIDTNHLQGMFLHVLHLLASLHSLPSTAAPLKRRRTRPSMPRGLRQAGFMRLKRSAWNRVNFLVRFLGWPMWPSGNRPGCWKKPTFHRIWSLARNQALCIKTRLNRVWFYNLVVGFITLLVGSWRCSWPRDRLIQLYIYIYKYMYVYIYIYRYHV